MTDEQFELLIQETIPQALFHVEPTDKNIFGGRLDEEILIGFLYNYPEALGRQSLQWFIDHFIHESHG